VWAAGRQGVNTGAERPKWWRELQPRGLNPGANNVSGTTPAQCDQGGLNLSSDAMGRPTPVQRVGRKAFSLSATFERTTLRIQGDALIQRPRARPGVWLGHGLFNAFGLFR